MLWGLSAGLTEGVMARATSLKRKSFFIEERALERAKKALGVPTDAEVVRLSLARVAEMDEFWRFMKQTRRTITPGSIKRT
jgi:hypothetical protein